jgi:ferredoxin-NADP reductase
MKLNCVKKPSITMSRHAITQMSGIGIPIERASVVIVLEQSASAPCVPHPESTGPPLCGPLPFMRAVRTQLVARGVPAADIHYEVFGPDPWLAPN